MKKFFRILVFVFINLVTLPVQIGVLLFILASNLTEDEWDYIGDISEELIQSNNTWIKTGRISE